MNCSRLRIDFPRFHSNNNNIIENQIMKKSLLMVSLFGRQGAWRLRNKSIAIGEKPHPNLTYSLKVP